MPQELRFAFYAMKKNIQSSAELRTSFFMNVIGMAINNIAFILLWVFFVKSVGIIGGWTSSDIIGLQGFIAVSFGILFSFGAGLKKLPDYVASGALDRFMLSPKNLLIRIATSSFSPSAVGDILFGVTCLAIYGFLIHIGWYQVLLMFILVLLSTVIFGATIVTIYSTSFFFIDSHAVTNGLFELFFTPALFHGGAFQGMMRFFFIFIIPSLLIGTLPVEALRDVSLSTFALLSALALIWIVISISIFHKAIRKYESTNFMTFGS